MRSGRGAVRRGQRRRAGFGSLGRTGLAGAARAGVAGGSARRRAAAVAGGRPAATAGSCWRVGGQLFRRLAEGQDLDILAGGGVGQKRHAILPP